MTLTKIEAEIEIPDGFEFDRIDRFMKLGDYDSDGDMFTGTYLRPQVVLRRKPKPAKPAYRVYRLTDTTTTTVDRGLDTIPDDVEWLGDWIEYDPPKQWPTPLVERIAEIDLKAAEWLVNNWDELLEDRYINNRKFSRESVRLDRMFDWRECKDYDWFKISKQLGE